MAGELKPHVLVFPYPSQGHMLPLLDLIDQIAARSGSSLAVTILVTPKNLSLLNPILSRHPPTSIQTLVLPFPSHPSVPAGIENAKNLPPDGFFSIMPVLGGLYQPLIRWFRSHPSPPVAIFSDIFLGWTHHLASELGIPRFLFSPSGATTMSLVYFLWQNLPKRTDGDEIEPVSFPSIPNSPVYPWNQISPVYRSWVEKEGDPAAEFIRDSYNANISSWGVVINSFTELEGEYLEHLCKIMGHRRVWAVGPLLPPPGEGTNERGGSSSLSAAKIMSWLDPCDDRTVVYVCFGSQHVLTNDQMAELTSGLEKSGVRFILSVKAATTGHAEEGYGRIPAGFEDRTRRRGLVIREWAPQVAILNHRAVAAFMTHCGWNSTLEGLTAGVPMLTWPMGADQYINARLLVDELKVSVRACEGAETVPDSRELARLFGESVHGFGRQRARAVELRKAAVDGIREGGNSFQNLQGFIGCLSELPLVR